MSSTPLRDRVFCLIWLAIVMAVASLFDCGGTFNGSYDPFAPHDWP